nr:DUF3604 domain-containing protein [Methylorubrum extorquens]
MPLGNTVDVASVTWSNTIGSPELIAVWKAPEFDPEQRACYSRDLEILTHRWTAYDAKRYGESFAPEVPNPLQEHAYTSQIWYSSPD